MGSNVVICCDGTNNSMGRSDTNIARVHLLTKDLKGQESIYDVGVGVEADPRRRTGIGRLFSKWSGSAFGSGLIGNVEEMYKKIREKYTPGDRLYFFGFSRGAYTVKVLAGLLKDYGLARGGEDRQVSSIVRAYADRRQGVDRDRLRACCDPVAPHFLGLFDAVSSVGWAWNPTTFPWSAVMPDVRVVRHALALDERRAKFRPNRVTPMPGQDVKEVWFAGVHSDVGGGYQPPKHQLGRVSLLWMLEEAEQAGMQLNDPGAIPALRASLTEDEQSDQNESLDKLWWGLEWIPLPHRREVNGEWIEERRFYRGKGWRTIRKGDLVSRSVQRRRKPPNNRNWGDAQGGIQWL